MNGKKRPGEFELIASYFAPLAVGFPGALGLADDGALIAPTPGHATVATVDMLIRGVHFLADDSADLIARKLLRVNLSDLAAMGAKPSVYFLAVALPDDMDASWISDFASGLATDQVEFGIILAGGDTTATDGAMTLSLTALGEVPEGTAILRSGASPDQDIYVSGTIGDAALGLKLIKGEIAGHQAGDFPFLATRYRLPEPRVALGIAVREIASAGADISDGLVADLGHICEASGAGAEIDAALLPLSDEARRLVTAEPALVETVLTGGDDYELVLTVDPSKAPALEAASQGAGIKMTRIGRTGSESRIDIRVEDGDKISIKSSGYKHF